MNPYLKIIFGTLTASGELYFYDVSFYYAVTLFDCRKKDFPEHQMNYTRLSWNVAEGYTKKGLNTHLHISSLKYQV